MKRAVEGPLPAVDRLMSRTRTGSRLARLIEQSGVRTTPSAIVMFTAWRRRRSAAGCCGVVRAAAALPPALAAVGAFAPFGWLMHRRSARLKKFEEQFPEALDLLSRAIRAGHAFQTALGMAADEMPAPVGPGVQEDVRPAELRPAAARRAQRAGRAHQHPRRALLRHRRPDPARDRRQPVRDPRQPRARRPRAVQDPAAGARPHGARPLHRIRAAGAAGVPRGRALRSSTPITCSRCFASGWAR